MLTIIKKVLECGMYSPMSNGFYGASIFVRKKCGESLFKMNLLSKGQLYVIGSERTGHVIRCCQCKIDYEIPSEE